MDDSHELEVMGTVLAALKPMSPEAQSRVVRWVIEKLTITNFTDSKSTMGDLGDSGGLLSDLEGGGDLPPPAKIWLKQSSLSLPDLEEVFHIDGEGVVLIAPEIPGKSLREKAMNCYVLCGITTMLKTGKPEFSDDEARAVCQEFGCLDKKNHATYLKEKGNDFTGSKDKGWTLTVPGKKKAAALIVELGKNVS